MQLDLDNLGMDEIHEEIAENNDPADDELDEDRMDELDDNIQPHED